MNEAKEAIITALYVNPPKAGKKNGTIKAEGDVLYLAKPPILAIFQQGGQYKIGYEEYEINGVHFKEIKAAQQVSAAAPATSGNTGRYPAHQDDALAERIFVCGAINATMSNPNVKPSLDMDGIKIVNFWRNVWASTFGAKTAAVKPKDDMGGDDIPY